MIAEHFYYNFTPQLCIRKIITYYLFQESTVDVIPVHDQTNIYVSALTELENTAFEKSIEKSSSNTKVVSSISLVLLSLVFYITTWL